MNDRVLNVTMPSDLYKNLQEEAKKKNISLAALVRLICSEYLQK